MTRHQAFAEAMMDDVWNRRFESINSYLLDIVDATRRCEELRVGVSTRGALCLYRASQCPACSYQVIPAATA